LTCATCQCAVPQCEEVAQASHVICRTCPCPVQHQWLHAMGLRVSVCPAVPSYCVVKQGDGCNMHNCRIILRHSLLAVPLKVVYHGTAGCSCWRAKQLIRRHM
jgi:hypothetical protein